jgi:hypothetical protein
MILRLVVSGSAYVRLADGGLEMIAVGDHVGTRSGPGLHNLAAKSREESGREIGAGAVVSGDRGRVG